MGIIIKNQESVPSLLAEECESMRLKRMMLQMTCVSGTGTKYVRIYTQYGTLFGGGADF